MALLVAGVATQLVAIGVVGFLVMLGAAWYAYTGLKAPAAADPTQVGGSTRGSAASGRGSAKRKPKSSGTSMQRLEERWRRRREGDDRQ